jgi:hypothetical protein
VYITRFVLEEEWSEDGVGETDEAFDMAEPSRARFIHVLSSPDVGGGEVVSWLLLKVPLSPFRNSLLLEPERTPVRAVRGSHTPESVDGACMTRVR